MHGVLQLRRESAGRFSQDDCDMACSRENRGFQLLFLRLQQFTAIVVPGPGHACGRHVQFRTFTFGLWKAGLIFCSHACLLRNRNFYWLSMGKAEKVEVMPNLEHEHTH